MSDRDRYFRADPRACAALPTLARRGSGLRPKADIWWWLGLHAYVDAVPRMRREYKTGSFGAPAVTVPFSATGVLASMEIPHRQAASRDLSDAMQRLASAFVEFDYTRWERGAGVVGDRFQGHLVTLRDRLVTLHCYPPSSGRYYLLLSQRLFNLRAGLGETATSVLMWLCFQQRGRKTDQGFRHRNHIDVTPNRIDEIGAVVVRAGHRLEAYRRVVAALEELERAAVVRLSTSARHVVRVSFSTEFFHTGTAS